MHLPNCQDNTKLVRHYTARYKMEWIYTQTKMSDQGSLELALIMKKKERMTNCYFLNIWLRHVRTIVLMNELDLVR